MTYLVKKFFNIICGIIKKKIYIYIYVVFVPNYRHRAPITLGVSWVMVSSAMHHEPLHTRPEFMLRSRLTGRSLHSFRMGATAANWRMRGLELTAPFSRKEGETGDWVQSYGHSTSHAYVIKPQISTLDHEAWRASHSVTISVNQ